MRTAPTLLTDAVASGLVDPAEVVAGRAAIRPVLGSNLVHRVDRAGLAVAYVKQAGAASVLDLDDTVAVETQTLHRLAGLAPVPLVIAGGPESVWTAPVAGVPLALLSTGDPSGTRLVDLAAARLGRALADLHWVVLDLPAPIARMPWPLHPDRVLPSMRGAVAGSACAEVLAELNREPVRSALAAAAAWWRADAWIHGDLSAGNVIVADRRTVSLIDLEAAGCGDPGWDVVCAEAALAAVDPRPTGQRDSLTIFRTAYAEAGGLGQPTAALRCARELMTAWQYAAAQHAHDARTLGSSGGPADRTAVRHLLASCRTEAQAWLQEIS